VTGSTHDAYGVRKTDDPEAHEKLVKRINEKILKNRKEVIETEGYFLDDSEWAIVEPLIPPAKRGGRKRSVDTREVLNAIFYVLWTGCQWKALPKDLPPKSTVHDYLELWNWDGTLERIHHVLYVAVREQRGAKPVLLRRSSIRRL
jgi:transposase